MQACHLFCLQPPQTMQLTCTFVCLTSADTSYSNNYFGTATCVFEDCEQNDSSTLGYTMLPIEVHVKFECSALSQCIYFIASACMQYHEAHFTRECNRDSSKSHLK